MRWTSELARRGTGLAALLGLLAGPPAFAQPASGPSASKLSTVLADLAGAVPQVSAASPAQPAGPVTPLSTQALPGSVQQAVRHGQLRINASNEVQVYILLSEVSETTLSQLVANGVTVEVRDARQRRVQARLSVSRLAAVAQLPAVHAVRLPTYARHRVGAITSEGDPIVRADAVRAMGLDGTGVRVGVISDGLKGVFATGCTSCQGVSDGPIASGDLPTATGSRNANGVLQASTGGIVGRSFRADGDLEGLPPASPTCGFAGAGAEGTALLEIVHDVAPGAKLAFANGDTDLEFSQAVNFLAASNDVVLDDIGFYGVAYDGTSAVSQNTAAALNNPAFPIRAYFTAAGNDADRHYDGSYVDSGIDGQTVAGISAAGHLHLFQRSADTTDVLGLGSQPYNQIVLPQNGEVSIFLTWDDPFGASANNYDLYLVRPGTGQVVARSVDVQNGTQDPVEVIDYVNTGTQDSLRIIVQNVDNAAQPRHLNIFSLTPPCAVAGLQPLAPPLHDRHNYNTPSRSISAQADAAGSPVGVMTVGAICSASAGASAAAGSSNESCLDTASSTIEPFSSRGPTLDGRVKPDIAAIDGVTITGAGGFTTPFFGTSAAVPHLGGIAALLLQSAPCLLDRASSTIDPEQARSRVRSALVGGADPLGGTTPNNTFGFGLADAVGTVRATMPTLRGPATLTVDANSPFGASLDAAQLGFADPNGCGVTRLSWSGGCGSGTGPAVTCPVGTTTASVSASTAGSAFSDPVDMRIQVTGFSVAVSADSATVPAGSSATFVVTVSAQGGSFGSDVTLACSNLPTQASCTFDPPAVSPGAGSARSTLTISTGSPTSTPASTRTHRQAGLLAPGRVGFGPPAIMGAMLLAFLMLVGAGCTRQRLAWLTACGLLMAAARPGVPALSASALASGIAVFPGSLAFGSQLAGTTSPPKLVYITNIGADPLTLTAVSTSAQFSQVNNCLAALPGGQTCQVAVSFSPTGVAVGTQTGVLNFNDDAGGSIHTESVSLSGVALAAPSSTGGTTPAGSYGITVQGQTGTFVQTVLVTLVVE